MAPQCRKKAADGVRYAAGPQAAFAKCKGRKGKTSEVPFLHDYANLAY